MDVTVFVLKWIRYGALIFVIGIFGLVGRHTLFRDVPKNQVGGAFSLQQAEGKTVTDRDFHGLWMLVFFGYTHCPDVCPTGLQTISDALQKVPPPILEKLQPLFISLDPERDAPKVADEYAKAFHPKFIGLTGTPENVASIAQAYRVFFRKSPGFSQEKGDYTIDHSAATYLMSPDGTYDTWFSGDTSADTIAQYLVARL